MGIFQRVSRAWGGAEGHLDLQLPKETFHPGGEVWFTVTVKATASLKAKRLMARLRGDERITAEMKDHRGLPTLARRWSTTYKEEVQVAGPLEMQAGESHAFRGSMHIPEEAQPTYYGKHAQHRWYLSTYLETTVGQGLIEEREIFVR